MGDETSEKELLASYQDAFKLFDNDGSGFISKTEFIQCMANVGNPISEEEFAELMKNLNKNEGDEISFQGNLNVKKIFLDI